MSKHTGSLHLDTWASDLSALLLSKGEPGDLLTDQQIIAELHVSQSWLKRLRRDGMAPPIVRQSPRVKHTTRKALVEWLVERARRYA
jgi:hypothetical protein